MGLSPNMEEDFILLTVQILIEKHKDELKTDCLIHSDQGIHYRAVLFQDLLKDNNIRQSMSRKANCWDNSPQESFHGHMKDEIDISKCETFEEVKELIDTYINYYNNERPQWGLAKLTPREYYEYTKNNSYPKLTVNDKSKETKDA